MSRKIYNRLSFMAVSWLDESTLSPYWDCILADICHGTIQRHSLLPPARFVDCT